MSEPIDPSPSTPSPSTPSPCPIAAQLVAMLLESRSAAQECGSSMYVRLLDLEAQARQQGAPEATQRLVARVRRIAGTAVVIPFPRQRVGVRAATRSG